MKRLSLVFALLLSISSSAQDTARKYVKGPDLFRLIAEDSIRFDDYFRSNGAKQRWISTKGDRYTIIIKHGPDGKYQEFRDQVGTLVGTVFLNGKNKYDVVTPSGDRYEWKKISGKSWSYQLNGKTVLTGTYQNEGKVRILTHAAIGEPIPEILSLSSYERGSEIIISKSSTGTMILVAILVTIVTRVSL